MARPPRRTGCKPVSSLLCRSRASRSAGAGVRCRKGPETRRPIRPEGLGEADQSRPSIVLSQRRYITGDRIRYRSADEFRTLLQSIFGSGSIERELRIPPWRNNVAYFVKTCIGKSNPRNRRRIVIADFTAGPSSLSVGFIGTSGFELRRRPSQSNWALCQTDTIARQGPFDDPGISQVTMPTRGPQTEKLREKI